MNSRGGSKMEWLERMNRAIDYIEENLTGDIELSEVASMACCSSHQFQRMFSFITDVTLAEYIRRRRLTLAALELQHRGVAKVIDVALKYGYDSPVSFARAFHALHGITPAMARQDGIALKAYPRLSFLITIRGADAMNYRIETKESFEVFGIEGIFHTDGGEEAPQTPAKLWEQSHANGDVKQLEARAGVLPSFVSQDLYPVNAVCSYRKTGPDTFPYMLCAFKEENSNTDGYTTVTIPAYTWVIFPSEPHHWEQFGDTIETLYRRFYTEWLPTAGYEQVDGVEFEMNGTKNGLNYIELWFAVRKM
ncbi:MAG: effector binding domain-containing protein [Candidatus Cohnella colombiensis]|uniref:Effector binding domain-containing protein n=1 Tax=Candidatus Cohnella colombiensis TaxID=3121368 RepID=A0AA95EVY3_9BACL|nr:MAG: effector binding domain-containing protein [Cohnella sp.]